MVVYNRSVYRVYTTPFIIVEIRIKIEETTKSPPILYSKIFNLEVKHMDEKEVVASMIANSIKEFYDSNKKSNADHIIRLSKLIYNADGEFDHDIVRHLKKKGISLVWNTVTDNSGTEQKLGLRYKDIAFQVD